MSIRKPTRQCVACRLHGDKTEFFRLVRLADSKEVVVDDGKSDGRGVYLCKNQKCIEMAAKKNLAAKHLKISVNMSIYDDLRGRLDGSQ